MEKGERRGETTTDSEVEVLLPDEDKSLRQYGGVSSGATAVPDEPGAWRRVCRLLSSLTIEPVMFSFMFGYVLNMSVLSNMIMEKGCLFQYRYPPDVCANLSGHAAEKTRVEQLATQYSIYTNLLSFVAAFVMIFVAPWSDKYGRKPPMLLALVGLLLTDLGYVCSAFWFDSRLFYVILSRLSTDLFGGFICIFTVLFSLASELSSPENRSIKYTTIEVAFGLGLSLGGLAGGFVYKYYGYVWVYALSALCHVFACLWAAFYVQETRGLGSRTSWREKAEDFFVLASVSENVSATFRKRPANARCLLLLLILCMCLIVINYESFGTIAYVFVHHVFDWGPTFYSVVNTTSSLVNFALTMILVPVFIRVLRFNDFALGVIGTVSMMAKNIFLAFSSRNVNLYYAGLAVGVFNGLTTLSIRTGISKVVDKDEVGRVFSVLATCETILPIVGTIAMMDIFQHTMDTYPNVTYTTSVFSLTVPLVTFVWAMKKTRTTVSSVNVQITDRLS